jgi:histidinol-phosphate aminotransferase
MVKKSMNISDFVKNRLPYLRKNSFDRLKPYTPGEQPKDIGNWIKLNTNENAFDPPESIINELVQAARQNIRLYPDPNATELRKNIIKYYLPRYNLSFDIDNLVVANGSDEILDIIFKTFIDPGDTVIDFWPSYGMYAVLSEAYEAREITLDLNDNFSLSDMVFQQRGKLLIICSPNNPDGNNVPLDIIRKILETFPGMVLIDEAYADFANQSAISLLPEYPNLIICRTFSKSFSMASIRLGFAFAHTSVISLFNTVRLPYNVSYFTQMAGIISMQHWDDVKVNIMNVIHERERVIRDLKERGFNVLPTQGNFYLIKFPSAEKAHIIYSELRNRKILVRYWDKPKLDHYLRVTVGLPNQNNTFINELMNIIKK